MCWGFIDSCVLSSTGINKPDIRLVFHVGMPKSIESYYQQTGRAGRDGCSSRCILLFSRNDLVRCYNIATKDIGVGEAAIMKQNTYGDIGGDMTSSSSVYAGFAGSSHRLICGEKQHDTE